MAATVAADQKTLEPQAVVSTAQVRHRPSMLVAIASYGTAQDHFLERVVAQYLVLDMDCRIVVLSNIDKPVQGAEVRVGLPSRDPYSLPFAHRRLFLECANDFDLFVYTEDDTLITPANIHAFLDVQQHLQDDEIVGFLRSETSPEGIRYIVSANSHFRWLPDSVFSRGPHRFAQFSNQHSGCFIATRGQIARAIASGGFTVEPRADRYGMLETAASDIYTQCRLKRVICLTRTEDFIVPHLANKYYQNMGVPALDFEAQVKAVCALPERSSWRTSLFNPETRAPGFRWSKHLYRAASKELLALVPTSARRVLSVGATMGHDEIELQRRGFEVTVVPLDAVFGDTLARRGLTVHAGPLEEVSAALAGADFDVVLAADMLHLLPKPLDWIRAATKILSASGEIVGSVSNTSSWLWPLKDWRSGRPRWIRPCSDGNGAQPMSERRLRRLCQAGALELAQIVPSIDGSPGLANVPLRWVRRKLAPQLLFRIRRGR
jgi:SAM-dependent methyltransferase